MSDAPPPGLKKNGQKRHSGDFQVGNPDGRAGRPTDYRPEFCERVVELGRRGFSLAMIAFDLDTTRKTLQDWCSMQHAFSEAIARARELSLGWWETQGLNGIWSKDFNANAYRLQVVNRFPDDWRDVQQVELRGALANLDMNRLSDEQLARIAGGEPTLAVLASAAERAVLALPAPAEPEEPKTPAG